MGTDKVETVISQIFRLQNLQNYSFFAVGILPIKIYIIINNYEKSFKSKIQEMRICIKMYFSIKFSLYDKIFIWKICCLVLLQEWEQLLD